MAKNQNYYVVAAVEAELDDGGKVTANLVVKLEPGCDSAWLQNEISNNLAKVYNHKVDGCIITSLSQISRVLYNRLRNLEE